MKFNGQRNRRQFTEIFNVTPPPVEVKGGNKLCAPFTDALISDEADSHTNLKMEGIARERFGKCSGNAIHRNSLADRKLVCQSAQTREMISMTQK